MATSIGELFAKLTLQSTSFQKELRGASRLVDQQARFMRRALAGIGVGFSLKAVIDATVEQERALKLTENAIRATGRTGRVSARELADFATQMQRTTTFADEQVLSLQSLLLRYRNIGENVLPRVTKAVLDFAAATGRDATSAATLFGRAFNDPIKGMNQLARAGVALSASQRETIKTLVESGRLLEAQAALAGALEASYKGAAEAARNTLGGALTALRNAFGELLEQDALLGTRVEVERLIGLLQSPEFRRAADAIGAGLAQGLALAASAAQNFGAQLKLIVPLLGVIAGSAFGPVGAATGGVLGLLALIASHGKTATQVIDETRHAIERLNAAAPAIGPALDPASLAAVRVEAAAQLAATEAKIQELERQIANRPAALGGGLASAGGLAQGEAVFDAAQAEQLRELEDLAAILRARLEALGPAGQVAAAALDVLGDSAGALSDKLAKAQAKVREFVEDLELQARVLEGQAAAAEKGVFALEAYNRQVVIAEAGARAAEEAIGAGLSGRALGELVIRAQRAAERVGDLKANIEATTSSTEALSKAAEENARDLEAAAERNAEALAEPFRNAFQDLQTTFTSTFAEMLSGGIDSWTEFWGSLKTIAFRFIANILSNSLFTRFATLGSVAGGLIPGAGAAIGATAAAAAGPVSVAVVNPVALHSSSITGFVDGILAAISSGGLFGGIEKLGEKIGDAIANVLGLSTGQVGSLGQVLGAAGSALAGGFAARQIVSVLELSTNSRLEKLGETIGSSLGGVLGAAGLLPGGIGPGLGAGIGGIFGAGIAGVLAQRQAGQPIFAGTTLQAITRGASLGAASAVALGTTISFAGGLATGFGAAGSGAALGAAGGAISGPVGILVGSLIGILVAGIIKALETQKTVGVATAATLEGLPSLEGGLDITRKTPFGFIGVSGAETSGVFGDSIGQILQTIQTIDDTLAKSLTRAEEEVIKLAGLPLVGATNKRGQAVNKISVQRVASILEAVGIPDITLASFGFGGNIPLEADAAIARGQELLVARRGILDFLDELSGVTLQMTEAERAIEAMREQIDQFRIVAPTLGILRDWDILEQQAIERIIDGFNDQVMDGILAITDPLELVLRNLQEVAEARLREATELGANLVEVERLNALERTEILKQVFRPIDTLLEDIRTGVGILPGAQVEANAEVAFRALASQVSAGQFVDPSTLVDASQTFLDASRAINASSVAFFDDLALVRNILEAARLNLPGFQHGGSFRIPGSGVDNVVPLFRASGGETVTVSRATGTDGSETASEVRGLRRDVEGLREDMRLDRSLLKRLAYKVDRKR